MKITFPLAPGLLLCLTMINFASAQEIMLSKVLLISSPEWKEGADHDAFEKIFTEKIPASLDMQAPGVKLNLYRADRGQRNLAYLMAWLTDDLSKLQSIISGNKHPFSDKTLSKMSSTKVEPSGYLDSQGPWTCYELIGSDKVGALPKTGILGIHYIQILPDKQKAFEEFVVKKLHTSLSVPGMRLLYYKGVDGEEKGSYITIYAIESYDARERFWPTGAPETQELKDLFQPYKSLAQELKPFLVVDSYLKEDTGAGAAIFESLVWTDYKLVSE